MGGGYLSSIPGADIGIVKGGVWHCVKQGPLLGGSGGMLPWKILDNTFIFLQSGAIWEQNRCYRRSVQWRVLCMNFN